MGPKSADRLRGSLWARSTQQGIPFTWDAVSARDFQQRIELSNLTYGRSANVATTGMQEQKTLARADETRHHCGSSGTRAVQPHVNRFRAVVRMAAENRFTSHARFEEILAVCSLHDDLRAGWLSIEVHCAFDKWGRHTPLGVGDVPFESIEQIGEAKAKHPSGPHWSRPVLSHAAWFDSWDGTCSTQKEQFKFHETARGRREAMNEGISTGQRQDGTAGHVFRATHLISRWIEGRVIYQASLGELIFTLRCEYGVTGIGPCGTDAVTRDAGVMF